MKVGVGPYTVAFLSRETLTIDATTKKKMVGESRGSLSVIR